MIQERKIKGLKSQIKTLTGDSEALKIEISNKQKELSAKNKTIKELQNKINSLQTNGAVKVSEHALVRYFERVKGYDIEKIKNEILTDSVLSLIKTLGGSGSYPNNNFKVVMKNNTVTTIV